MLVALLDALSLPHRERNRILVQAGYAPDGASPNGGSLLSFGAQEASGYVDECGWPAVVSHDLVAITHANPAAWLLLRGVAAMEQSDAALGTFSLQFDPTIIRRVGNWQQMTRHLIALVKGHHLARSGLPPSPLVRLAVEALLRDYPGGGKSDEDGGEIGTLWHTTPPCVPRIRHHLPLAWLDPEVGAMDFDFITSVVNVTLGIELHEWIPTTAETWTKLQRLIALHDATRPSA
jgi:hypothetical protein